MKKTLSFFLSILFLDTLTADGLLYHHHDIISHNFASYQKYEECENSGHNKDNVTQNLRDESKSMFNYKIWYRNDSPPPNDNTHTIVLKDEGWYDYLWSKTTSCNIL